MPTTRKGKKAQKQLSKQTPIQDTHKSKRKGKNGGIANVNKRRKRDKTPEPVNFSGEETTDNQLGSSQENPSNAAKTNRANKDNKRRGNEEQSQSQNDAVQNFSFNEGEQVVSFGIQGNDSYAESEEESEGDEADRTMSDEEDGIEDRNSNRLGAESSRPNKSSKRDRLLKKHQKQIKGIDDEMATKLYELHGLMEESGLVESAEILRCSFGVKSDKGKQGKKIKVVKDALNRNNNKVVQPIQVCPIESEETMYTQAVRDRTSSSTDEIDTSDECINPLGEVDHGAMQLNRAKQIRQNLEQFVITGSEEHNGSVDRMGRETPERSTSARANRDGKAQTPRQVTPQQQAEQMIKEAEAAKARIMNTPGKNAAGIDLSKEFVHSVMVDENYSVVAARVDEATYAKIVQGRYIDFAKLIPKDKITEEEEDVLPLVRRNGKTFYAPVKEGTVINSFSRWEQAFRVFSNIYTQEFPHRSSQLIQYNHVIHDIAQSYIWSNVYAYDKDFRIHLAKNPQWSWGIILQQSWSLRLKEKLSIDIGNRVISPNFDRGERVKSGEPCRRYNRGKCNYGVNCKYEHRCSYCYKFGHNVHVCRKASADRGEREKYRGGNSYQSGLPRDQSPARGNRDRDHHDEKKGK